MRLRGGEKAIRELALWIWDCGFTLNSCPPHRAVRGRVEADVDAEDIVSQGLRPKG